MMISACDLEQLMQFIKVPTPKAWLEHAPADISLLLRDHAHCERKAAATALNFISKYPEKKELIAVMSPLAREELLHFEKVLMLMQERNVEFRSLKPSRYAQTLHQQVVSAPAHQRLSDQLIVGAIIEARSCERFYALASLLDDKPLARFYHTLVKAEARHFKDYIHLARLYGQDIEQRLNHFLTIENTMICQSEEVFRFHSGIPLRAEVDSQGLGVG